MADDHGYPYFETTRGALRTFLRDEMGSLPVTAAWMEHDRCTEVHLTQSVVIINPWLPFFGSEWLSWPPGTG